MNFAIAAYLVDYSANCTVFNYILGIPVLEVYQNYYVNALSLLHNMIQNLILRYMETENLMKDQRSSPQTS